VGCGRNVAPCTEGLFSVKSFLNGLERRFFDDLMLLSTEKHKHIGVDVFAKPRIIDVLDAAQIGQKFREELHAREREKLYSGHCDFVVQRRDNWRFCIVEADGPRHFDNGDTILRDTALFQLATKAKVALLRLDDSGLRPVNPEIPGYYSVLRAAVIWILYFDDYREQMFRPSWLWTPQRKPEHFMTVEVGKGLLRDRWTVFGPYTSGHRTVVTYVGAVPSGQCVSGSSSCYAFGTTEIDSNSLANQIAVSEIRGKAYQWPAMSSDDREREGILAQHLAEEAERAGASRRDITLDWKFYSESG
jgi:hypothetical protein